ncbi:MAG: insulinase family protein [Deltaproteobacteria bacterium]|nr:MAG: insulinase family protein [Deltaproteobacteria bacterium]
MNRDRAAHGERGVSWRLREPERFRQGALRVLYDPVPGPLTAIALAVRAGSRFDGPHPGIAHMTEHMLFQGTGQLDQAALNRRAGELGGEHDADTGYEDIALHFEVFNEDVEDALGLFAEQCFHSTVPADRLAKEQRVVIDEIRGRQEDPGNYVHERAWARFFGEPLGHPVCGTITSVKQITRDAVRAFIGRHFVPANMVLALVGGVGRDRIRRALRRAFPGDGNPPRIRARRARTDGLFQEIRERLGLGYDLSAAVEQGPDWAVAVLAASAARDEERRLRETLDRTCRDAAGGFAAEELARARKKVRYRFARLADSRLERAIGHAARAACAQPSLVATERLIASLRPAEVEEGWRRALAAPSLTAVLRG